ncbi:hypothetical protein GCM10029964_085410 [Kibdelosporangium lantanae]
MLTLTGPPDARRTRRSRWIAALLATPLIVIAACSMDANSGLCTPTTVNASPVTVTDRFATLTLRATLTAGATPVASAPLTYYVTVSSPTEKPRAGFSVGQATTGPHGVATFVRPQGMDGLALGDERLVSFEAQFAPSTKIGGVQYCQSRGSAPVTTR